LCKPYGINLRCYSEHLGEKTWELGEPDENMTGTRGKKIVLLTPLPKGKKLDPF